MSEKNIDFEDIIMQMAVYIKKFHSHLTIKYQLTDIPFFSKGKAFPKKGVEVIDDIMVEYWFHGGGCSLKWGEIEIHYNTDASSKNEICISTYPVRKFIQTNIKFNNSEYINYNSEDIERELEVLEKKGVLMTRKPYDLGMFHVNEVWCVMRSNGLSFNGENKDNIDWI
ncbi:DUF6896 domain-containing protein [Deminuibacter soli]|uniref:DUF6896 domain-containing protein n=1 Tax=Deminuibacter soli TaxID=2291815 RepID=A0A3E1NJ29_9BACT|nr:hypothetical protein [Deminuibacter soli]RFM27940.1 hypothetical protein DXN05_10355 [Deminuibacter soli]